MAMILANIGLLIFSYKPGEFQMQQEEVFFCVCVSLGRKSNQMLPIGDEVQREERGLEEFKTWGEGGGVDN